MKTVKKLALGLVIALIGGYLINFFLWLCLYDPANQYERHRTETLCLEYLSEMLGRGTEIQIKDVKHKGFGVYHETVTLNKRQLVKIDISGDKKNLGIYDAPYRHVYESLTVRYFGDSVAVKIKNPVSEKYNGAKLTYPQTGLKDLFTTNQTFSVAESSAEIIARATNCTEAGAFEYGSLLFSCLRPLTLEQAVEYADTRWAAEISLETQAFAVKTGETADAPVLCLRVQSGDTAKRYAEMLDEMLQYVIANAETAKKFLNTSLFGNVEIDFAEIKDYLDKNGIEIVGYNSFDSPSSADRLPDYVALRESDGVSKLVGLNNGTPVFI